MDIQERILFQNKQWSNKPDNDFPFRRQLYEKIWNDLDTKIIALITGPRRVGKSIILKQLIFDLINKRAIDPRQILFFEFSPTDKKEDIWEVYKYFISEITNNTKPLYIFFDEVQYLDNYESTIKEIYDNSKACKFFLTGSLSLSYKRKMEESLAGRFFTYELFPLNFAEYLSLADTKLLTIFKKAVKESDLLIKKGHLEKLNPLFRNFLRSGRFPEIVNFDRNQAGSYIQNIVSQSLNQDVYAYFDIQKPRVMNSLFKYFQENNGMEISINKLSSELGTSNQTINQYIKNLQQMNLVYLVFNTSNYLKKDSVSKKVYINSSFSLLSDRRDIQTSTGFAVESYILEQLLERGEDVTFWRKREKEIDFLLPKKKIGYEIKFRNNPKETNIKLNKYQIRVISLNQEIPACLF